MKLEIGMFIRTKDGMIAKIQGINEYSIALKNTCCERLRDKYFTFPNEEEIYEISKASFNLIDLIEYMDLFELTDSIRPLAYEDDIKLFNPVRCDGFTTYEDGTECMIINLDYIVKLSDLKGKIGAILTHEQYNQNKYVVE